MWDTAPYMTIKIRLRAKYSHDAAYAIVRKFREVLRNCSVDHDYRRWTDASMRQVTAHLGNMNGGVCLGITMSWIKEELTTSNSLLRADGPLRNSAVRQFSSPANPLTRISSVRTLPVNPVHSYVDCSACRGAERLLLQQASFLGMRDHAS
jgi:hypothetical protein